MSSKMNQNVSFSKEFKNLIEHISSSSDEEEDDSDYKPSSESESEDEHLLVDGDDSDVVVVKTVTSEEKEKEAKENVIDVEEERTQEHPISFYKEWSELESWEIIAAQGLEYTKTTWNDPYECPWDNLPDDHKDYIKVLGMDEEGWFQYQLEISAMNVKRMDPYDHEFYTRQEFCDYYGNDDIWQRMDPKLVFYREALQETYRFATSLSPMIQTKFIDCMMETY